MPSTPRGAAVPLATRLPLDRLRSNASERSAGFREPIRITPAPPPRSVLRRPLVILWSIFAAVALIAAVVWARLLWPSSSAPEASVPATSTTATTSSAPAPAALGRARSDHSHVTKACPRSTQQRGGAPRLGLEHCTRARFGAAWQLPTRSSSLISRRLQSAIQCGYRHATGSANWGTVANGVNARGV